MAGEKADAQATFSIDLLDGTSGAAESAGSALKKLQKQIGDDTSALAAMQRAMKNLQGGTSVNIEQFRHLKAAIDAKKQSIAQAQSSYMALGGTFGGVKRSGKPAIDTLNQLGQTAKGLPGPLGGIVSSLSNLKGMLGGGVMALGVVAIAAAVVALTVAAVAATAALLRYGIAQAGARRSELLRLEGLTKMRSWSGIAAGSASEMQAAIDKVSESTALGRDKVESYAAQLYKMGLRGNNLSEALDGTAMKASVLGDEAASGFMGMAAGANFAGQSVKRLSDDVRARLGGVAAAQMLDLDVQAAKLKESFGKLWAGIKLDGLLKAVKSVTSLFSQSTRSGQALKVIVTTVFQPMINAIEYLGPVVKRFFQGLIIGALLMAIAVLKLRNWFRKTFGDSEVLKGLDLQKAALYVGVVAVAAITTAFVLLGVTMVGAMVMALPWIWAAVTAVGALAVEALILAAPFILGAVAIGALIAAGYQLYKLWQEIDWTALGTSIVEGIVDGLNNAAIWLTDAVKDLAGSAMKALKDTLGIASPSKAFARLGLAIPQGIEAGVETGTPSARAAVAGIVDAPRIPDRGGEPTGDGQARSVVSSGGVTIHVGGVTVQSAGEKPAEFMVDLEREVTAMFERVAVQIGAVLPGGAA
jgi:hypothetical protein